MVRSHYRTETIYDYSWFQVVQAYWNRYPNPSSTHVLTEDTIKREVRDGKLYSRRILSKTNPVPKWGERFYKNTPVKILEDSILDLEAKTLVTYTRNIGFKKVMKVDEVVEYREDSDGRTLAIRNAYVSSKVYGFSYAIRAFGIERFKSNCLKAAKGFNFVLQRKFPNGRLALMTSTSNDHTLTSSDTKLDVIKRATKSSYCFLKNHAAKITQIFSIKN